MSGEGVELEACLNVHCSGLCWRCSLPFANHHMRSFAAACFERPTLVVSMVEVPRPYIFVLGIRF